MQTQQTKNYESFKSIVSNREVDIKHVNRLIKAIRINNLLHLNPIIVNSAMEVIDGQHRLAAAEQLGVEVHYLIDDQVNKQDIATINSNSKNWSAIDYINFWTIEKRPGFDKLSSFLSENPMIPPSTALKMLSYNGINTTQELREGHVDTSNYEQALAIAAVLKDYRNIIDWAYERYFVLAVMTCMRNPDYDHNVMRSKLEYQSRSLVKCISVKQYVQLLEEIYNYRSSKNLLKLIA